MNSRHWIVRFIVLLSLVAGLISFSSWDDMPTSLDSLAFVLLFAEGVILSLLGSRRIALSDLILWPLIVAAVGGICVYLSDRSFGHRRPLEVWTEIQLQSHIFPYFFKPTGWSDTTVGFYKTVLLPIFKKGIFGWFASMVSLAFFVSGTFLSLFSKSPASPGSSPVWRKFNQWRAPDFTLIVLVAGLAAVAYGDFLHKPSLPVVALIGWNITIFALFPIFIQGISVASYFVPKLSFFFLLVLFGLLLFNPIPVLILAGLADLWFDFRSRIGSNPKA